MKFLPNVYTMIALITCLTLTEATPDVELCTDPQFGGDCAIFLDPPKGCSEFSPSAKYHFSLNVTVSTRDFNTYTNYDFTAVLTAPFINSVSSLGIFDDSVVLFFTGANCTGRTFEFRGSDTIPDLSTQLVPFNDAINSFNITS